jgi:hypothetical protein
MSSDWSTGCEAPSESFTIRRAGYRIRTGDLRTANPANQHTLLQQESVNWSVNGSGRIVVGGVAELALSFASLV